VGAGNAGTYGYREIKYIDPEGVAQHDVGALLQSAIIYVST
jgi:hypothetical protein